MESGNGHPKSDLTGDIAEGTEGVEMEKAPVVDTEITEIKPGPKPIGLGIAIVMTDKGFGFANAFKIGEDEYESTQAGGLELVKEAAETMARVSIAKEVLNALVGAFVNKTITVNGIPTDLATIIAQKTSVAVEELTIRRDLRKGGVIH